MFASINNLTNAVSMTCATVSKSEHVAVKAPASTRASRNAYNTSIAIGYDAMSNQATHDALPLFVKHHWRHAFICSVRDDICDERTGPRRVETNFDFTITYQLPGLAVSTFDDDMLDGAKIWLSFKDQEDSTVAPMAETGQPVSFENVIVPSSPTLSDSCLSDVTRLGSDLDVDSPKAKFTELAEDSYSVVALPRAPHRHQYLFNHFFGAGSTTNYPLVAELVNGHGVVQKSEVIEVEEAPRSEETYFTTSQEALRNHFFGGSIPRSPLVAELINGCGIVQKSSAIKFEFIDDKRFTHGPQNHFFTSSTTPRSFLADLFDITSFIPTLPPSVTATISKDQMRAYTHFFGRPDPTSNSGFPSKYPVLENFGWEWFRSSSFF